MRLEGAAGWRARPVSWSSLREGLEKRAGQKLGGWGMEIAKKETQERIWGAFEKT